METIGEKIKLLRVKNNLKLRELGRIIGLSDTALSNIENGKTKNISIDTGKELAKALNISFNELFEIDSNSSYTNNNKVVIENKELKEEIKTLKKDLDNYRNLVELMADKQMIGSPRLHPNEGTFKEFNLEETIKELEVDIKRQKEIWDKIKNDPFLFQVFKKLDPSGWLREKLNED